MRTAGIIAALAATFNSALADVLCNSEIMHYKPRIISVAERDGFANTIDEVCSNTIEKSVQEPFESTIFSRIRTEDTFSEDECKANFQSIIEACVAGKNAGGGSFVTNGLTVKIHLDSSNNKTRDLAIAKKKKVKKPIATIPKATKPKATIPKPGSNKDPNDPQDSKKPKDKTPEKPPAGKACKLKPDTGKGKDKGKNNNDKKTPTKVVRALISKLLGRAGSEGKKSSDYGSDCGDIEMTAGGDWGDDTYRGRRFVLTSTIEPEELVRIARSAYNEVRTKRKRGPKFVVAALFVPNQGVFLGTVPHEPGDDKVRTFAPTHAPVLWEILKDRTTKTKTVFHAEDMAMLYAIESLAVDGNSKFPAGSMMATWGNVYKMQFDAKMPACGSTGQAKIDPSCHKTLEDMEIAMA